MIKVRLIIAVYILVAFASALLYRTSYAVDELQGQLAGLNRAIVAEQENIQVLGAEWTYLSEPRRIEQLAAKYLKMEATKPQRVAAVRDMNRLVAMKGEVAAPAAAVVKPTVVAAAKAEAPTVRTATVAYRSVSTHAATTNKTTPNQVKLLLASFQPGRDMNRE